MVTEYIEFNVYCSCGCGAPAGQFVNIKGIVLALPLANPSTHYRNWRRGRIQMQEQAREQLSLLEHMTPEQFEKVRRQL